LGRNDFDAALFNFKNNLERYFHMTEKIQISNKMLVKTIESFKKADGRSEFVIAVVCDIRGFSNFSVGHEAPDIAMFIKRFYVKLLEGYFPEAIYAKPTGDGLLMLFTYSESTLAQISEKVLLGCSKALADYPSMLEGDPMINYELPKHIGFGVARGTAFCLFAPREIVDYSGQTLNLAARLNDFARPSGIVVDGNFQLEVIPEQLRKEYSEDSVCIRGVAETEPRKIYISKDVSISESARQPIRSFEWEKVVKNIKCSEAKKLGGRYFIQLPSEPLTADLCKVICSRPKIGVANHVTTSGVKILTRASDADGYHITVDFNQVKESLLSEKIKADMEISLIVQYVPKFPTPIPENTGNKQPTKSNSK